MSIYLNPLVERLARRGRWPSVRAALWLAFGLGLAGLAVTTRATLRMESVQLGLSSTILLALVWLVTILSPPITSVVAIILVSRDASSEMYELLRLTTLSKAVLVKGYVFAALHRVRVLLALVVGLMPALAVGMVQVSILVAVIFYSIMLDYSAYFQDELYRISSSIDPVYVTGQSLACMAIAIGLWGLNWPAAALGVGLALRWRGRVIVTIIAPMVTLLVTLLIAISLPVLVMLLTSDEMSRSYWGQPYYGAMMLAISLFALLAPYALGAGMTRLAQRWAREP